MKKVLAVGIVAVLFTSLFFGLIPSSVATEYTTVKISPATQDVSQGQSFIINVIIDPHTPIAGAQFNLQFNPSLIQIDSVTEGNLLKQNGAPTIFSSGTIDNNAGVVKSVWGNTLGAGETVSNSGNFAIIRATSKNLGTSPIDLITIGAISVKVSDPDGNAVPINIENGSVNIQNGAIGDDWVINGDTVEREDAKVYMGATPYSISSGGYVYFDFIPKTFTGDADFVWGFDVPTVKPTKAELYFPHWNNWTTNHEQFFYNVSSFSPSSDACDFGNSYNSLHYNVTYETCDSWDETTFECKGYKTVSSIVCFDSAYTNDDTNYTVYWHTDHSKLILWKDISTTFTKINYNHGGMNTWYYVKNVPVVAGQSYQVRAWVDVPITTDGVSGKYWWAVKPSSESISEAISLGHFYALDPWYSSSWSHRKQWSITNVNATTLTNFAAYLNVSDEPEMQADWDDVVFTDSASNLIPYELENYTSGFGDYWVNLSSLPGGGTYTGWTYYGNGGASSQENPEGVWDSHTKMVHHSQDLIDSTSNNNDATNHGATYNSSGIVDGAYDFNGTSDYWDCGSSESLNITTALTLDGWVKPNTVSEKGYIIAKTGTGAFNSGYSLYWNGISDIIEITGVVNGNHASDAVFVDSNVWVHAVITVDGSSITFYRNGEVAGTQTDTVPTTTATVFIGDREDVAGSGNPYNHEWTWFGGSIDNVIVSSTARSADWINQSYEMVVNQSTWVTWGSAEVSSPVITLVSQTPSTLYQNSTGDFNVTWLVKHCSDGLNTSSVAFIYTNYGTMGGSYNHSIRVPSNDRAAPCANMSNERICRADNRNNSLNFEDNDTITGGNVYEWGGGDENTTRMTISAINSTHSYVYWNGTLRDTVFCNMFYLDRTEQENATMTQYGIYKDHYLLAKIWDIEAIKGHDDYIFISFADTHLGAISPNKDLEIYYLNESYNPTGSINPEDSLYSFYLSSHNATSWVDYKYSPYNSTYIKAFVVNQSAIEDAGIEVTKKGYLYYRSSVASTKPYYLNLTNSASSCNRSFAENNVAYTGSSAPFSEYPYTPNIFVSDRHEGHQFQMKLYAADNNGFWGSSSLETTNIGVARFPPTTPSISHFNYPIGTQDYDMDGTYANTFDVGVGVATDPDGGTVTHNLTLHYANETIVAIINNTFTEADVASGEPYALISFNSTPYYSLTDTYTMRVVAVDDEGKTSQSWLGVNFSLVAVPYITSWWNNYTKDNQTSFVVDYLDEVNRTIFFNVTANQSIDYWIWYKDGVLVQNSSADNYTASWDFGGDYTLTVYGINPFWQTSTLTWNVKIENSLYEQNQLLLEENKMIGLSLLLAVLIVAGIVFFLLGITLPHSVLTLLGAITFFITMALPIPLLPDYPYFGIALTSILLLFGLLGIVITFYQWFTTYNSSKGYHKWDDYFNNQQ